MSQFSIPLNPVAQPTNQFVAPRIQQPSNDDANQLNQLSGALSQIAPELRQILSQRAQAAEQGSQARADQDFVQKRLDNTKALKAAVDKGQIAETDNPWYMVQLRQDVAANEAAEGVRQVQTDWENSPVRFSDDPKAVEDWAKQQLAPVVDGKDAYETEAMAPIVQQGVSGVVSRHMDVRREEREQERVANFQQRVSTLLTGPNPSQSAQALQSLIKDARLTMPGASVNAMVIKAAQESAESTGDEGVLSVLSSIPNEGAGGTLADFPEIKQLQQQLPLMRLRRSNEIDEYMAKQAKLQQEAKAKNLTDALFKANGGNPAKVLITPELAQSAGIDFQTMIDTNTKAMNYGSLVDEQGDKAAARVDKNNTRLAHQLQGQTQSGIASGKIKVTDPEVLDSIARVSTLDPDAGNQLLRTVQDFQQLQGSMGQRLFARESDPVTYANLWNAAKTGTLTSKDLIPQAQKLSHEDWTSLFHETIKTDSNTKVSDFPMSKYDDLMKDMIVFPKASSDDFGGDYGLASKDPAVNAQVTRAQTRFAETVQGLLADPAFTKLPRDQQTTRIRQALDSTAQEFGGVTDDQRQRMVEAQNLKAEQAKKASSSLFAAPVSSTTDGVTDVSNGQKIGAPTLLTDQQRGLVRSVADSLDNNPRSLTNVYQNPNLGGGLSMFKSDWWGPNSLWNNISPPKFTDRNKAYLAAFVANARTINGGYWTDAALNVSDPKYGSPSIGVYRGNYAADAGASAAILYESQRTELAGIRKDIEKDWITPANQAELFKLTASISGLQASGQEVPAGISDRFKALSDQFRLHDFLSVTAGVTEDDVAKDWRVLYQYPAAANADGLKNLVPLIHAKVPPSEREAVIDAQRLLMARAKELLTSGHYKP